jgi:N-acetylglucosamine-6-phosphate deacetylase
MLHRLDNYLQAQLAEDSLYAGFIADGHHIPFYTLKNFLRAKTFERSLLVTDAMAAADQGPGVYTLGSVTVRVSEDLRTVQPGKSHLSGSALTLDRAVVNVCIHCGVPFDLAWSMASTVPAELIGLDVPDPVAVEIGLDGFRIEGGTEGGDP